MSTFGAIEADGLYSVSFSTNRLGSFATGFSLNLVGQTGTLEGVKTVTVSDGLGKTGVLGSEKGILLSSGKSLSRTYHGDMSMIVDPAYDLFGKLIVIQERDSDFIKEAKSKNIGAIRAISHSDARELFFLKLAMGDVAGFLQGMLGEEDGSSSNVVIDYSKANDSLLLQAITSNYETVGFRSSINMIDNFFRHRSIFSIGDLFAAFIAPLGLELYWEYDNKYSLEPTRLAEGPKEDDIIKIDDDTIIEYNSSSDTYNAPDLVIPSFLRDDIIGAFGLSHISKNALEMGLTNVNRPSNNTRIKISTYDVPNFIYDPVTIAMNSIDIENAKYTGSASTHTNKQAAEAIATFYMNYKKKSDLYRLKTGSCLLELSPHLTRGYSWYEIRGEKVFVSDIRHNITRSSATTSLTIAGKEFPMEEPAGNFSVDLSQEEEVTSGARKAGEKQEGEIRETREINKKRKPEGSASKASSPEEQGVIFMRKEDFADEIKGTIVESVYPNGS